MIAFLRGIIQAKITDSIVVELHDIGYRVLVPAPFLERVQVGDYVEIFTHEVVRDTSRELFGCPTRDALQLFLQLISVSGIGPKGALGLLSIGEPQEIRDAIAREDAVYLSKVVGVGRKTAERVVVELKGKMQEMALNTVSGEVRAVDGDVMDALIQLGYKAKEVRDIIRKLPTTAETSEAKLKAALQALGK